jgi:uncharacterized protein
MMLKAAVARWCAAIGLALVLLVPCLVSAQVAVPVLAGHVTDQTSTLTPAQTSALEQLLSAFEAQHGTQLAVLMVSTTQPEEIEQYALRVAEQWKLGRKKIDDGVILVVAKDDRTLRIEVGYGLEGALSDIVSKRIISETITPRFKQGDFYGGLQVGVEQIMGVVAGETLPPPHSRAIGNDSSFRQFLPILLIVALGLGVLLRSLFGKVGGSLVTGVAVTGLAWWVVGSLFLSLFAGIAAMFLTLVGAATVLHGVGAMSGGGGLRGGGGGFGGGGASGRW